MAEPKRVFRYPITIRWGYPVSFLTWLFAPALPAAMYYVIYWFEGRKYVVPLWHYYSQPVVTLVVLATWIAATSLVYQAMKRRSAITVTDSYIEGHHPFGSTRVVWSNVDEIVRRHQLFRGNELNTYFVRAGRKTVIFADRILSFRSLIECINERAKVSAIPLYCEDYEKTPLTKVKVARL